jgi:hypothetical protein
MRIRQTAGLAAIGAVLVTSAFAAAQTPNDPKTCPMHAEHAKKDASHAGHHAGVDQRGDHVMGFSHETTRHHFRLTADGGLIEVVTAGDDAAARDRIRNHLREVAAAFAAGDFSMPRAIHDRVLPGVEVMAERKDDIAYTFEELDAGARVRIVSRDERARAAIHDFLRSQIEDHRTGDPLTVQE